MLKKFTIFFLVVALCLCAFVVSGCADVLRFAPSEPQKQNAWLHQRTAALAADAAKAENASPQLQSLTSISESQAVPFVSYFGLPQQVPKSDTAADVLSQSSLDITNQAALQSTQRPDVWKLTDSALELGIAIASIIGGVYGVKAVQYLNQAKEKSKALSEIIKGNELFKASVDPPTVEKFKAAQSVQSPETRVLVTELKT